MGRLISIVIATLGAVAALQSPPAQARPGAEVWVSLFNGPPNRHDRAEAVAVSPDGSVAFVTGSSPKRGTSEDYVTVAYRADNGRRLWSSRYDGPADLDFARALAVAPDGTRLFVTGFSTGLGAFNGGDIATVAYDAATGELLWVSRYDGPESSNDLARAMAVSPDGMTVFVTGTTHGPDGFPDYVTVAYDATTGRQLWVRMFRGPARPVVFNIAVAVSTAGSRVVVTGSSDLDYLTIAYNGSTGSRAWIRRYDGPAKDNDHATALVTSPDGTTAFVTGYSEGSSPLVDYATVAYDVQSGDEIWVSRYDGPVNGYDAPSAISVSTDGTRVFVTGRSEGEASDKDYATVAHDSATGNLLWVSRYNGPGNDYDVPSAVVTIPGRPTILVSGISAGRSSSFDWATMAYDQATGARQWIRRYNGSANDSDNPTAMAAAPDGMSVFVTGGTIGSGTNLDYTTIAYDIS